MQNKFPCDLFRDSDMKRSNSARSLVPPASRSKGSTSLELPELPPEMWMHVLSFLHLCDDDRWVHNVSSASKRARTLIFESVTEVTLSSMGEDHGIFQNTSRSVRLSPSSISLLSRFPNANRLTLAWAPTHDILKTHMSGLSNLTYLCVGVDAVVLPSSVAHPLKLDTLRLHKRTSSHWKIASTIDKGEDGGIARFANLSTLETNSKEIFLGAPSSPSSSSSSSPSSSSSSLLSKNVSTLSILPKLSALKSTNVSISVLNDSRLKLSNLTSLSANVDCDLTKEHVENLVSLTTLEINQSVFYPGVSLNSLTNLKTLRLKNWSVPEDCIADLSTLTGLSLRGKFYENFFCRAELREELIGLRKLELRWTGTGYLPSFANLTDLVICAEKYLNPRWIWSLPSLVSLSLKGRNPFEKGGIEMLTNLRALELVNTSASVAEGAMQLVGLTHLVTKHAEGITRDIVHRLTGLKRLHIE